MGLKSILIAKGVKSELNKQDPEALGIKYADIVDQLLDDSSLGKRSENIQVEIASFLNRLVMAFNKRLLEDAEEKK